MLQVALDACPTLVYSNNEIKAMQTGGGFSVLQMLSLPIVHTTYLVSVDTIQDLDVTIFDAAVVFETSMNALYMLMFNSKAKE